MNGHRRFLITLGLVQLAFACGYVGFEPARSVALEGRAASGAAYEILEELERRGALREPADFDEQIEREGMVIQSVRERLERSRGSRRFLTGMIAAFGVLSLVVGCIPDRRRALPQAED
ncbi:MAG: hypothetical protein RIE32_13725 [Phycisphaerales bacterium]